MATILVADDDQLLRTILRDHLERADHEVLEAGDGIAAIDIALEERPEVLLLDVMMPLARGLEVVRRVRQTDGWHPVIVMISARTRVSDRLNALDAGADAYVEKPFEPDALLETVERLLSDVPPARYVDILGPIWATLAIDRLARHAVERRTHDAVDPEQVTALFSNVIGRSLGRAPGAQAPAEATGPVMHLMWEDTLRALLRDATDPVPVITEITTPDALAAVQRLMVDQTIARHRTTLERPDPLGLLFSDVLDRALTDRPVAPRPPRRDAATEEWAARLRAILAPEETPAKPSGLDPLQELWLATAEHTLSRMTRTR